MGREKDMATRGQMVKLLTTHPDMTYQEIGEIVGRSRQRVLEKSIHYRDITFA